MVLAIGIVGGIFIGRYVADIQLSPEEQKLRTILGLIREQYVDDIDIDSLMEKSIPDILASLDPHSAYIPKSELTITNNELESSFGGVGVSFQVINDTVTVVEVVSEGPAEKVGIGRRQDAHRVRNHHGRCILHSSRQGRHQGQAEGETSQFPQAARVRGDARRDTFEERRCDLYDG